jgi:thiosulfate/3-mercaptopyruvate sulfurtransferase
MPHNTLLDAATLRAHLHDPDWIVFDVRHDLLLPRAGIAAWRTGHIPGALFLPLDEALSGARTGHNGRHPLPDAHVLAGILAGLGVKACSQVVVYDDAGSMFAARLWWLLRWLGHEAVAVLDGGVAAWKDAGGDLEEDAPAPRVRGDLVAKESLMPTVSAEQILASLGGRSLLVVDARSPERFRGEGESLDPVGGHIPGACNRFFRENLVDGERFKAPEALRAEFERVLEGRSVAEAVMQCGSGVTACHNLLALEVAGLSGAALYPGSWSEWCVDPRRPVER